MAEDVPTTRRETYLLDLLTSERRRAWQEAADRNDLALAEFIRRAADRVARFGDGWREPPVWDSVVQRVPVVEASFPVPPVPVFEPEVPEPLVCVHPPEVREASGFRMRCSLCGDVL